MNYILVGGAWPYANGSLHIGHVASLLPGDVIARYHRAIGDKVFFVSGSDCHGTPVAIRAKQEGKTPQEISDRYHKEFKECFEKLGFSYDCYTKTSSDQHKEFVKQFHKKLYESPYVYEKIKPQAYCEHCNTFLADRFVTGKCPVCGADTRGDQCDACGAVLEPESLVEPVCAVCKNRIAFRDSKHLYIAISKLEKELKELLASHPEWPKNAIAFTQRYIDEGLRDRALTRDLDWGIEVPKEGYEDKKIYIWAENVLGYLSASKIAAEKADNSIETDSTETDSTEADSTEADFAKKGVTNDDFSKLWGPDAKHYYVHGKDNIPFHTIILPSLLLANGGGWHLPDQIVSSEYLTLEGQKISTSHNYAIWIKDIVDRYDPDSIRYYFLANGPEKKDADFSWREFVNSHNGELLAAYGNFVNRTLVFIEKYFDRKVPDGVFTAEWKELLEKSYQDTGKRIIAGELKVAIGKIFELIRNANKYFDTKQPWNTRTSDPQKCGQTIYNCVQLIVNFAVLLHPFLPFSSEKIFNWLQIKADWKLQNVPSGYQINDYSLLFERLDKSVITEEEDKVKQLKC